jgi:hypothetical protein
MSGQQLLGWEMGGYTGDPDRIYLMGFTFTNGQSWEVSYSYIGNNGMYIE